MSGQEGKCTPLECMLKTLKRDLLMTLVSNSPLKTYELFVRLIGQVLRQDGHLKNHLTQRLSNLFIW
jgi:hypothetical protein